MDIALYGPIIVLWIIVFWNLGRQKKIRKNIIQNRFRSQQEKDKMTEAVKQLIGKDTFIKLINDSTESGIVKELVGKAVVIENIKTKATKSVNIDYIATIQEYPHNSKGKRKQIW